MLQLLSGRENGTNKPNVLFRAERTRRVFALDLSKYRDVDQVKSAVNCIDIDLTESK